MKIIFVLLLFVIVSMGLSCASARMKMTEFDDVGNVISVNEITYTVAGARQVNDVDINLKKGKAKIGSSKGNAGDLAEALLNITEVAKKLTVTQ